MRKIVSALLLIVCATMAVSAHAQIAFRSAASSTALAPQFRSATSGTLTTVAFRSASSGFLVGIGALTVARPAGIAVNDVLIVAVAVRPIAATVTPVEAGWTLIRRTDNAAANANSLLVYRKVITNLALEPAANYTFTIGGGATHATGGIQAFSGVDNTNPVDVEAGQNTPNATNHSTPNVTTTVSNTIVAAIFSFASADAWAPVTAGLTERFDVSSPAAANAVGQTTEGTTRTQAARGAVGVQTSATSGALNDVGNADILALRPALRLNLPAGVQANDVLFASVGISPSTAVITPPAGWALVRRDDQAAATSNSLAIYQKIATAAEPTFYDFTVATTDFAVGGIQAFFNVDTTTPVNVQAGNATASANTHAAPSVTPTVPNTMLVTSHTYASSQNWTAPAGMTESFDITSGAAGAAGQAVEGNFQYIAAAGAATGTRTATAAGATPDTGNASTLALQSPRPRLTINVPAGTVANDQMIAAISVQPSTATVTAPAGWTLVRQVNNAAATTNSLYVYRRTATAAEPASYTWDFAAWANGYAAGGIQSFSGVDTATPVDVENGVATASALTHATPSVTTTVANTMVVTSHAFASSATWTAPAGMTEAYDVAALTVPDANGQSIEGDYVAQAAVAATGAKTATASGNADSGNTHILALRPAVTINHFSISHSGSGVACVDQTITLTAHDSSHSAVNANGLTLALSTTNGRGTWTGIVSGGGTLTDLTAGDGAASYTFAAGSSSVQLAFRYANLAATSETFGFNVSGGGFSETTGTAIAGDDPAFTMSQAGFQFRNVTDGNTTILAQISGKPSDTGFNARTVRIQAIQTDTVTGSCTGLFASQTRTVDLGAECNSPASCAGQQASINGANIATSNDNVGAGAAAYTGVSLTFNASSEADTVIAYPDAGQISLHARYDFDPGVAGFEMLGSSNAFVVRPFGFAFRGATAATAIQHGTAATDPVLVPAGDNFTMTMAAYRWAVGEDANNDGIPDAGVDISNNGLTPNFAANVTVAPGANLPGVALGTVSRGATCLNPATIAAGSFAAGSATVSDWCYSEAGNAFLTATSSNYISAGVNITGNSGMDGTGAAGGYVGRFRPKNFAISGIPALTNRSAAACAPVSGFTYMGEGLSLGFTLVARNTQGATTQNYNGAYAKLGIGTFANFNFGARSGVTNLIARVDSSAIPLGSWLNGVANITATTGIRRATPDNPDGPYTAVQFGIAPVDSDGVAMNTLDFDADADSVNERTNLGVTTEVRFGRMRLDNAYGSTLLDLPLPLTIEYYNSSGVFILNASDSCTTLQGSDMSFAYVAGTPNLTACETAVNPGATMYFVGGKASTTAPPTLTPARLIRPGNGNDGAVDLVINLNAIAGNRCTAVGAAGPAATNANKPWLQGNWGAATYDRNPRGRAAFGVFKSADQFLYLREVY